MDDNRFAASDLRLLGATREGPSVPRGQLLNLAGFASFTTWEISIGLCVRQGVMPDRDLAPASWHTNCPFLPEYPFVRAQLKRE
jgi:hypothetical protein